MNRIDDDKKWEGKADADDDTLFLICLCSMYSSLDVNTTDSNTYTIAIRIAIVQYDSIGRSVAKSVA